jgi:hypothetical protein
LKGVIERLLIEGNLGYMKKQLGGFEFSNEHAVSAWMNSKKFA